MTSSSNPEKLFSIALNSPARIDRLPASLDLLVPSR